MKANKIKSKNKAITYSPLKLALFSQFVTAIATALVFTGSAYADQVKLPPSVGATPIEIPKIVIPNEKLKMMTPGTVRPLTLPIDPRQHASVGTSRAQPLPSNIPGLTAGLRHSNLGGGANYSHLRKVLSTFTELHGGDLGDRNRWGFNWYSMVSPGAVWSPEMMKRIPPGLIVGLKHSVNQAGQTVLSFNSVDVSAGRYHANFAGFTKVVGGDIGAPSNQGFMWFESTADANEDWSLIDRLPMYTIMGLRHSINLRPDQKYQLQVIWQGQYSCTYNGKPVPCDCTNKAIAPPPGFTRRGRVDIGAPSGEGFCWYEKRY